MNKGEKDEKSIKIFGFAFGRTISWSTSLCNSDNNDGSGYCPVTFLMDLLSGVWNYAVCVLCILRFYQRDIA